jgi:hypothetical protein
VSVLENSHAYLNLIYRLSVIMDPVHVACKYPVLESLQNLTVVGVRKHGAENLHNPLTPSVIYVF